MDHSAIEAVHKITERYAKVGKKAHLRHLSEDSRRLLDKADAIIEVNHFRIRYIRWRWIKYSLNVCISRITNLKKCQPGLFSPEIKCLPYCVSLSKNTYIIAVILEEIRQKRFVSL